MHTKHLGQYQVERYLEDIQTELISLFETQAEYQKDNDEILYFRRLLKSAFAAGNCHINNRNTQGPPEEHPHRWGWRRQIISEVIINTKDTNKDDAATNNEDANKDDLATKETWQFVSKGAHIGFIDEDRLDKEIWLLPQETYKLIKLQAKAQDRPFHTAPAQLWRQLMDKGHSRQGEKDKKAKSGYRPTSRRELNGVSHTIIIFPETFITGSEEPTNDPND